LNQFRDSFKPPANRNAKQVSEPNPPNFNYVWTLQLLLCKCVICRFGTCLF